MIISKIKSPAKYPISYPKLMENTQSGMLVLFEMSCLGVVVGVGRQGSYGLAERIQTTNMDNYEEFHSTVELSNG